MSGQSACGISDPEARWERQGRYQLHKARAINLAPILAPAHKRRTRNRAKPVTYAIIAIIAIAFIATVAGMVAVMKAQTFIMRK